MALSQSSRTVAGHLMRYSTASGSALRYSVEAQGPVISHGFLRNLRSPWKSDLPAPAAEEAAEAMGIAVVGSTEAGRADRQRWKKGDFCWFWSFLIIF
jgi:glycerophosphoryl diester phosphodiesterase